MYLKRQHSGVFVGNFNLDPQVDPCLLMAAVQPKP